MGKCMIKDCSAFLSNPLFFEHFFELITHKSTFLSWSLTRALFWALFWSMKLFWTLFWGLKKVDLLSRVFFLVSLLFWGLFWVLKKALKVQRNLYKQRRCYQEFSNSPRRIDYEMMIYEGFYDKKHGICTRMLTPWLRRVLRVSVGVLIPTGTRRTPISARAHLQLGGTLVP